MSMFKKLFNKSKDSSNIEIVAPLNGKIVPLEEVPDPVFSEKMMGDGIAIIPRDGTVVSPVNGKVLHAAETKHAVGIQAEDGTEILIHVGLETVALKGEGFELKVQTGEEVRAGQALLNFNLDYIKEHAENTITPIVITNSATSGKTYTLTNDIEATAGKTVIITVS